MHSPNKKIARRFIHAFDAGDQAALESMMVEHTTDHNPLPGQRPGRDVNIDLHGASPKGRVRISPCRRPSACS